MNFLIADDKEEGRYLLEALLKANGHQVTSVANGAEAFEKLKSGKFDLIISDILMPVMDGFELCRRVKSDHALRKIPFIIYTATYTDPKDEALAIKLGADRFILKPCEPEEFMRAVGEVMETGKHGEGAPVTSPETEEEEIFKLYNERLVKKLEDKMMQLEREVKKREEAEKRIQMAYEHWQKIFDAMLDPVAYLEADGTVRQYNRAFADFFGQDARSLVGQKCYRLIHRAEDHIEECPLLRSLQSHSRETLEMELDKRIFYVVVDPIKNSNEKNRGFVHIMRDITEGKKIEKGLRASEEKYRTLMESSLDSIIMLDTERRIVSCNQGFCNLLGYNRDEVEGKSVRLIHVSDKTFNSFGEYAYPILKKEGSLRDELDLVRKDGVIITVEFVMSAIRSSDGSVSGYLSIARDITERKRAEQEKQALQEQLRQSQKMEAIGLLSGGIAHDFNNMLTIISGSAQLSMMDLQEGDPLRANLEEIKKASDRAADLTRQLLAFSRKQILEMKVVDLNEVLQRMDKMLRRLIGENIQLKIIAAEPLGKVKVDYGQIEQVIINLCINARDAMPEGGNLTIETANVELDEEYARKHIAVQQGPYVMLAISDTGGGMTPEVKERIFEPFFTTKEMGKGTGLGLSTVYGIVKQSGGNIWVYSEPDQGTTFKIYLPRVEGPLEEIEEEVVGELPRGHETILVVEDEEPVRRLAMRVLKGQGYRVLEAEDGDKAFMFCEKFKEPIHLILTDVVMPGLSGRKLAERLQQIHPEAKVLYMSGYTDNAIAHHGILEPGINFIQKPFTVGSLSRKVREVLDKA